MSKRKSTNSVLSFDDVLNDINDQLGEKNGENDQIGDNRDEMCGKEEEINSKSSEECLEEEQQSEEPEHNVNRQQRYVPRKQFTCNRNIHDIDSSLDGNNQEEIVYMNKDGVLEELCGYLGLQKDKNTKKIRWSSEHPIITGRQRKCDTISGRISCLAPNSRANNIESINDTFHLYFDNDIIDKIVDCTNTRINETITRLQQSGNLNESSKYTQVKKNRVEIDPLFGLMYFRGIIGVILHLTERLLSYDSHFVFGATLNFRFLKGYIYFDNPQERKQLRETERFAAAREIMEIFNSNLSKHVAPSEYLSIDDILYPIRQQIAFRQYNPNKPRRYGLLLKPLNDARFPCSFKPVPYSEKPKAGDGLYYLKSTIDYIKYLVTEMEAHQPITGRTISTDLLHTSIESTNWLLDRGIATVGTLQ